MGIGLTCCFQWVLVVFLFSFFYHRNHIKEFIEVYFNKEDRNRLVSSVYNYVNNPVYLAGCRALGIIDKLLTGPLWRIIENVSIF